MGNIPYVLLKDKVKGKRYESKSEMQNMLDIFMANNRISPEQYQELSDILTEQ